jgi:hypothetical protein
MIVLTFLACLGAHCELQWQAWRTAGIGDARACRAAYHYARARLPEGVTVRELECGQQKNGRN